VRYDELNRIIAVIADVSKHFADGKARPAFRAPAWFHAPSSDPN